MGDKEFWQLCYVVALYNGHPPTQAARMADASDDEQARRFMDNVEQAEEASNDQ